MSDKQTLLRLGRCWGAMGCAVVGFTLLPLLCGCDGKTNGSSTPQAEQHEVEFADGTTAKIVKQDGRAVSLTMPDGRSISLEQAETKVGDQLVIQTAEGKIEVHRKPTALMNEMDRLPHLYLKEDTLEELITDGFRGEPYIGPNNALYWSARTCTHPDCDSQSMGTSERPYLLIRRLEGVWLTPEGTLASGDKMPNFSVPCPVCNRADGIRVYTLGDTTERRRVLTDELVRARDARARVGRN